ncbi:copper amine oxidase [Paenibacillus selenitireducens]|uniref:Copper amine oxidase n=1 Tax=Paenibacillus selenitireducens TaxID=1324314 RepID=A0A1T2XF92_9BACL|nr:copper amine oxidase N-terminal domain-containing protein [Paenibacillus selenitireducens]OPA78505.1 copper amine oxidase [Paenibacillus selenitireducens]
MNKKILVGSLALFLIIGNSSAALAHPGRTDSKGGHTCRTNCEKWGLEYGEYHYHNGGGASSSNRSTSSSKITPKSSTTKKAAPKPSTPTYQQSTLSVYVNDNQINFSSKPVIYQNTNLVPLREIAEGMGATIDWDKDHGTITITKDLRKVTLTLGSKKVFYDGISETMNAAPKIIKDVTYVPVQVLAKGLGASIVFDQNMNSLHITY